jgi:hypothetical protein
MKIRGTRGTKRRRKINDRGKTRGRGAEKKDKTEKPPSTADVEGEEGVGAGLKVDMVLFNTGNGT